eukprot:m.78423 g.78423  ORF g.78423 m.78423 type:complete len:85 (+) comp12533_c0_seq1:2468-2722(+)
MCVCVLLHTRLFTVVYVFETPPLSTLFSLCCSSFAFMLFMNAAYHNFGPCYVRVVTVICEYDLYRSFLLFSPAAVSPTLPLITT